ncbi:MAG: dihydrodipicolinate synthase family protein [Planctomycetaceae bacterium]
MPPIRPKRKIKGMSAILLPFLSSTERESDGAAVDWRGFHDHVARTASCGLVPAVNMDTGYGNLIDSSTKAKVLRETAAIMQGRPFIAGAFVKDQPGDRFDRDRYRVEIDAIKAAGGTPIIFQSHGLTQQSESGILESYADIGEHAGEFYGFELGSMFAPFGSIYSLDVFRGLLGIRQCLGAKHSSLSRTLEWDRLAIRDEIRPDFLVLTGNDLAIDMVMYGSDYLLGLSTFAPQEFAKRDAMWAAGDSGFYELNDVLQYLGFFAFRDPVPAYKHTAAQFLHLRGWIQTSLTHSQSPTRPDSDVAILENILELLKKYE